MYFSRAASIGTLLYKTPEDVAPWRFRFIWFYVSFCFPFRLRLVLFVEFQDGTILPYERETILLICHHRTADHAVCIIDVLFQIIHFISHMRIMVNHFRKRCPFLEFQVLNLVIIVVYIADPDFRPSL